MTWHEAGDGVFEVILTLADPPPVEEWPVELCATEFEEPLDGIIFHVSEGAQTLVSPTFGDQHCLMR